MVHYQYGVSLIAINMQVWIKNDLRLHDHPGLKIAETSSCVQPVYVLDAANITQKLREPNGVQGTRQAM